MPTHLQIQRSKQNKEIIISKYIFLRSLSMNHMTDTLVTLSKELESKSEIIFILTIHLILFIICLSLLFQIVHLAGLSLLKLENATNILHLKYPGLKPGPLVRQLFLPMET